jgi:hypothetical protein
MSSTENQAMALLVAIAASFPLAVLPFFVEIFVKLLAVVGGAGAGAWVVGFVVRRVKKWLGRREPTGVIGRSLRFIGAFGGGLLVWFMVFAPGGSGLFGGGGSLFGEKGKGAVSSLPGDTLRTSTREPAAPSGGGHAPAMRIILLGGTKVAQERFYLIEGEKEAHTLAEVKAAIKERQGAGMNAIELLIYENSVAKSHPAVKDLEKWARDNNLTVSEPPTKGEYP